MAEHQSQPASIPDAALEQDIAILGKKGRGKTYAAKGCVERLLAMGRRVIVLDPLSTWWGLKAGPGAFPIAVLGGPHADLPLSDRDGAAVGRHLATASTSVVLDLGSMRKAELIRFATAFLEELYTANRAPLWLVLEEADVFAPQQPMADSARLLGEVDRIARRGRQFGFRLISLTQRPAKLNKDVLTQLSTLVALGITSPQDREAIKAWVEGNADREKARAVVDSLAQLKVGEGWVWAPDLGLLERMTFPKIRTLDTSATPRAGEPRPEAAVHKSVDVADLRAALDASHGTPRREKQTPLVRTKENQEVADQARLDAAERRGYERGLEEGLRRGGEAGSAKLAALGEEIAALGRDAARSADAFRRGAWAIPEPSVSSSGEHRPSEEPVRSGSPLKAGATTELGGAAAKLLAVLDTNPPVRRSWTQVATLAGLRARGGHFNAGRKALLESGAVVVEGDLVRVASPSASAKPAVIDRAGLVDIWAADLSGAAPRILRHLAGFGPATRQAIAVALSMQPRGGHWNAGWKELRDNALVVDEAGTVRLADVFEVRPAAMRETGGGA